MKRAARLLVLVLLLQGAASLKGYAEAGQVDANVARIAQQEAQRRQQLARMAEQALSLGSQAQKQGNFAEARRLYQVAVRFAPSSSITAHQATAGLAQVQRELTRQEKEKGAATVHNDTFKADQIEQKLVEGQALLDAHQPEQAKARYDAVLALDPYETRAHAGLEQAAALQASAASAAQTHARLARLGQVQAGWAKPRGSGDKDAAPRDKTSTSLSASSSLADRLKEIQLTQLDFKDAPLQTVLDFFVTQSRGSEGAGKPVNFVIEPEAARIADKITLQLRNIPLADALEYAVSQAGVGYRLEGQLVVIVPRASTAEPLARRTFQVPPGFFKETALDQASRLADEEKAPRGRRQTRNPEPGITRLWESDMARVEAKVQLAARGVAFGPEAAALYNPESGVLQVYNTPAQLELVEALVRAASGEALMVDITTRIVEIGQDDLRDITVNLGVGLDAPGAVPGVVDATGKARGGTALRGSQGFSPNTLDQILGNLATPNPSTLKLQGMIDGNVLNLVLSALQQRKSFDLLSAPAVRVKSGEDAKITVGRTFYFPTEYQPPDTVRFVPVARFGTVNVPVKPPAVIPAFPTEFESRDVGVKLTARPQVGADGQTVDLALAPEVTDLEGFINYGDPVFITSGGEQSLITRNEMNQPVFNTRRVSTRVLIRDGYTVVLGGLLRNEEQKIDDKVPLLGDLPLVGRMFQSQAARSSKKNLLIFVTPRIYLNTGRPLNAETDLAAR